MVFFSSGSQCWYFSHEPSSGSLLATDRSKAVVLVYFYINVLEYVLHVVICILLLFIYV